MKKTLEVITGAALLALSSQAFSADNVVSEEIWVGGKVYDRAFGRGCGTCHDISSNPNLFKSVNTLNKEEFISVLKNGQNGMPKAIDAIMSVGPVKKAGYSEEQGLEAVYAYIKGRADGSVPEGKLKKAK
jgi:mono/diheme cytochrome c family protein